MEIEKFYIELKKEILKNPKINSFEISKEFP